ncbi:L,D-transpeptidase [Anaerocolumna sp. MB42-C2]|uniref:L,D-transpeptidase n=1 Tax=Anaerocolumna sp. MB42-C2 TaxID=3070997 RepID=UPI0027E0C9BE|nr:L,D-transpeptidase [Anaerocolumna sp. MB42-C2]WMJ89950.1 L,D-transpeptidase [Anaerocolumna sp. MB42-C2]
MENNTTMTRNKNANNRSNSRSRSKSSNAKVLPYIALGLLIPFVILYFFLSFYYSTHFYKNTLINGVNASNKTVKQVEDSVNSQVNSYVLTLEGRNDLKDSFKGENIGLHTVYDGSMEELLKEQNGFAWPVSFFKTYELEINTILEFDEFSFDKMIDKLNFFKEANVKEPVNAHISEYGDNGFEIVKEDSGAKVNKDKLYEAVKTAVTSLQPTLSIEEAGCYVEPKITSENPKLLKALEKMNKIAGAKITYQFGDVTEVLDGRQISKWLSVDKKYNVKLDTNGIKEYVDYIGKNYNSFGRVRNFKSSYGDVLQIRGGDYGWWLNRGQEVTDLTELIKNGEQLVREPAYYQTAQQYGVDDIGNTYVEVNLTAQHLFFYKEGNLVLETDFVSGNLSKDWGTPVGTYPVQYKENDATLNGEDYSTPVKYWMPFNGNIGFHDAPWRSEFGKKIYLTSGSHGCINMPPAAAKKMFENIKRGVAVVVYELPGTETYDKDKDSKGNDKTKNSETNKEKSDSNKTQSN